MFHPHETSPSNPFHRGAPRVGQGLKVPARMLLGEKSTWANYDGATPKLENMHFPNVWNVKFDMCDLEKCAKIVNFHHFLR